MPNPKRRKTPKSSSTSAQSQRRQAFKYIIGPGGRTRRVPYRLGRLGVDLDDIFERARNGTPDFALSLLLSAFTLDWMRGHNANICVQACAHLADAAGLLGMDSQFAPVQVFVNEPGGQRAMYGTQSPTWNGTAFTGHCILQLPGEDRFIDPTIRQIDGLQHLPYPYVGKVWLSTTANRSFKPGTTMKVEVQENWIEYRVVDGGDTLIREAEATRTAVAANPDLSGAIAAQTLDAVRSLGIASLLPARHERIRALLEVIGDAKLHRDGTRIAFLIDGHTVAIDDLVL